MEDLNVLKSSAGGFILLVMIYLLYDIRVKSQKSFLLAGKEF